MKTLAKYHAFNHCVTGEKHLKINLSGPVSYRDFRETGPRSVNLIFLSELAQAPNGRLGNFYSVLRRLVYFKFLNLHGILARIIMLFFRFGVLSSMVALCILASGCEVYSSLFSCFCFLSRGGNKFSIKFAGKMLKLLARLFINGRYFMD